MGVASFLDGRVTLRIGDVRDQLALMADASVDCVVTSPPYFGLRDYGMAGQIGLEPTPAEFVAALVAVFREVRRVLRPDGTCWINLGDSYAGSWGSQGRDYSGVGVSALSARQVAASARKVSQTGTVRQAGLKPKDLMMIPARVAIALCDDGWYLRKDIIWHKPNPMPESVTDRPTSSHEHVFLLTKSERYWYDAEAIREGATYTGPNSPQSIKSPYGQGFTREAKARVRGVPPRHAAFPSSDQSGLDDVGRGLGRNARDVWTIATQPFSEAHFATFPPALPERCILAGCPKGGTVLDPFGGAGTTALVALRHGRKADLIELNPDYAGMARRRIETEWRVQPKPAHVDHGPLFSEAS